MSDADWQPTGLPWQGCRQCVHFDAETFGCKTAYPEGIPLPIASGDVDHYVVRPGQEGTTTFRRRLQVRGLSAPQAQDMVDTVVRIGQRQHGINVHVFAEGESHRISVPVRVRRRLERWSRETGIALHTVAFDQRGAGHSGHSYYYQRGIKSTELQRMVKVTGAQHLRELVGG